MKTITVGIPSASYPKMEFLNSLFPLIASGMIHSVMMVPRLPVHQARERIVSSFSTSHLLFIDDDMVFTLADVQALIDADKPVVSGLYHRRGNPPLPICYKLRDGQFQHVQPPEKLSPVAGSLAFTLISKEVTDKVGPEFRFADGKGEDIDYMYRIANAGFEMWLEPKAKIGHLMEVAI